MSWKRSAGVTVALMGMVMTGHAAPWRADLLLVSKPGLAAPQVDGIFEPEIWRPAHGVLLELGRIAGPRRSPKKMEVTVRSLTVGNQVFFLVQWFDEYRADAFNPLVWTVKGGSQRYEEHPQSDDGVSLIFFSEGSYGQLMSVGTECRADLWDWGAGRTNSTQYANDAMALFRGIASSAGGLTYKDPFTSHQIKMQRLADGGTPAKADRRPTTFEGEVILPFVPQTPSDSLADVRAAGQWDPAQKKWSVEFARNLSTGYDDDVAFVPGWKYGLAVGLDLVGEDGSTSSYVSQLADLTIGGIARQVSAARAMPRPVVTKTQPRPLARQEVVSAIAAGDTRLRSTTKVVGQAPTVQVTRVTPPAKPIVSSHSTSIAPVGTRVHVAPKVVQTAPKAQSTVTPVTLPDQLPPSVPVPRQPPQPVVPPYKPAEVLKPPAPVLPANAHVWGFDDMSTGERVPGFQRQGGRWFVRHDPSAPSSPHVYAQLSRAQTVKLDPGAVYKGSTHTDFSCSVAVRILPESVAGGGLVFRHRDFRNFYALELDAREDTLRLVLFAAGREAIVGSPVGMEVEPDRWYNLKVECQSDQFTCYVDGQPMLSVMEGSLATGHVGLWTRRGTVAYFDDFAVADYR